MALETLLIKVKTMISAKPRKVGVLAFEIASLMSKLLHLWRSLLQQNIARLHNHSFSLQGVQNLVSTDKSFLVCLAAAEMVENLRHVAKSLSCITKKCNDMNLVSFDLLFEEFANSGRDPHNWVSTFKEMEIKNKKMDQFVKATAEFYKQIDKLSSMEIQFNKGKLHVHDHEKQKILWKRQEVKQLRDKSLWNRGFDSVTLLLARSIFTTLARIKLVFGFKQNRSCVFSRSFSSSATVHPADQNPIAYHHSVSGPLTGLNEIKHLVNGFFESNAEILKPPTNSLGGEALALHYANLIVVIEKMIKSPQLIGVNGRDDLYDKLPNSLRCSLRTRLQKVGPTHIASDTKLEKEWKEALGMILQWMSPLAHNMIKWQSERSFEQKSKGSKTSNVLLLETLYFADKEKVEAVITEMLVGLNYIWRFEREMSTKALLKCNS